MRINGSIDLGAHPTWGVPLQTWAGPSWGQGTRSVIVEGIQEIVYPRGGIIRSRTESVWITPFQSIGGNGVGSQKAALLLLRQLFELVNNRQLQPAFVEWQSGGGTTVVDAEDGWWIITDVKPDIELIWTGQIKVDITALYIAPFSPSPVALSYTGGEIQNNFSGLATPLLALPLGASAMEPSVNRTGAEGTIPCVLSPLVIVEPFIPSATIASLFKGGVHVYDTISTSTNAVPSTGGTFVNSAWVEVFQSDHDFVGDCVITNGLLLLLFEATVQEICKVYLWNTATAVTNWQSLGTLNISDNASNGCVLRSYSLLQVGREEIAIKCSSSDPSGLQPMEAIVRLQRGHYDGRIEVKPLAVADTSSQMVYFDITSIFKISYNSQHVSDNVLSEGQPGPTSDYGWGAAFIANSASPFIAGFLYQNQPGSFQPGQYGNGATILIGDQTSLAPNSSRVYGFFALPYGVSGSYSPANLQAEAESGTLGTGWTSQAGAGGNSNALEAKCASGTVATNADLFATAFVPDPGTYDIWFRVKVTSAAGSAAEMQLGLWDSTSSVFVASTTYKANQVATTYSWVKVAADVTPTAAHNMRLRAVTAATLGTDWFIDEAILVPKKLTTDKRGPQDLWQQWIADLSVRLIQ